MTLAGIGLAVVALAIAGWIAFALRRRGTGVALVGGLGVAILSLAVYAVLGAPGQIDRPLAVRTAAEPAVARSQERIEFSRMVAGLAERLRSRPDDLEGWTMLSRSYRALEQWPAASTAWARAMAIKGDAVTAADWAELADLRIAAARGDIDALALQAAERSLALDPNLPRARHFVALAAAQQGDYAEAARRWRALLADAPPDAAWRQPVAQQLAEAERLMAAGGDVPPQGGAIARPQRGPTAADVAAARVLSPEDRAAFVESMVQSLADRLNEQPDNPAGWLRLGRAYAVLGRAGDSAAALDRAERQATARLQDGDPAQHADMRAVLEGVRALRGE